MADCNFDLLIIGVETPNNESLKETGKFQNIRTDLISDIHKIFSYGIGIRPGMIVGFDNDGPDIFETQHQFVHDACMPLVTLNMLKAPIGTKLWIRLRQEGRMLNWSKMAAQNTNPNRTTNIVPKRMTRVELMKGFRDIQIRLHTWENFKQRMINMISLVKRKPNVNEQPIPLDNLLTLGSRMEVSPEGCQAIKEIFLHVSKEAPFMWRKVRSYIGTHVTYIKTLPTVLQGVNEQIDREETGKIKIELDTEHLAIPKTFRDVYNKYVFPNVYKRAYLNSTDKTNLSKLLMNIFTDFLVRWGKNLDKFEEYHLQQLYELTDQYCAKENGQAPELFVAKESEDEYVEKPQKYFDDDILKSVGQELIMIAEGGTTASLN
jgi:hypothetical protein